jgi:hypothetical protein
VNHYSRTSSALGPRLGHFSGLATLILQRGKKVIERDFRLLQDVTKRGTLYRSMRGHGDLELPVRELLSESDMGSALANDGKSQPPQRRDNPVVVFGWDLTQRRPPTNYWRFRILRTRLVPGKRSDAFARKWVHGPKTVDSMPDLAR